MNKPYQAPKEKLPTMSENWACVHLGAVSSPKDRLSDSDLFAQVRNASLWALPRVQLSRHGGGRRTGARIVALDGNRNTDGDQTAGKSWRAGATDNNVATETHSSCAMLARVSRTTSVTQG